MPRSPFQIQGPAVISFSGGRTSAYMLHKILEAGLDSDVHVLFADTGKELPSTYDFVRDVARRWDVKVTWVERTGGFTKLIDDRGYLPTAMNRWCTGDLKIKPMQRWMVDHGYDWWTNVVGLRYDEPHRVARMRNASGPKWDYQLPLADAKVTEDDVLSFWQSQPFDLKLERWQGNCDLCFLKGTEKKIRILQDDPDIATWWLEQERKAGRSFRKEHSVEQLVQLAQARRDQMSLPVVGDSGVPILRRRGPSRRPPRRSDQQPETLSLFGPDDLGDCICTD